MKYLKDRLATADLKGALTKRLQMPDVIALAATKNPPAGGSAWRGDGQTLVTAAHAGPLCSRDTGDYVGDPSSGSVGCSANTLRVRQMGWHRIWTIS
jgi:hypothetical protein